MRSVIAACLLAIVGGCSSSDSPSPPDNGGEDGKKISELVERMNDESNSVAKLKDMFATGTPIEKKQTKTYSLYHYDLKGKVRVEGTTATGIVAIEKTAGGEPVEKEWAFVKEGDKWKIKSAPMP